MQSNKNRFLLSLVLAGTVVTSCSAGIDLSLLGQERSNKAMQRRKAIKKAALISSVTVAAIVSAYLLDKYGMKKLDRNPIFADRVDEVFTKVLGSMITLCGLSARAKNHSNVENPEKVEVCGFGSDTPSEEETDLLNVAKKSVQEGWENLTDKKWRKENGLNWAEKAKDMSETISTKASDVYKQAKDSLSDID
jgi:hypothetical protein